MSIFLVVAVLLGSVFVSAAWYYLLLRLTGLWRRD